MELLRIIRVTLRVILPLAIVAIVILEFADASQLVAIIVTLALCALAGVIAVQSDTTFGPPLPRKRKEPPPDPESGTSVRA